MGSNRCAAVVRPREDEDDMRRLVLFRHGKAEPAEHGRKDRDRRLAERGRRSAPLVGDYLAHHALVPDFVLCSPALRTRETWRLAAERLPASPRLQEDDRLYGAEARELLDLLRQTADEVGTLLMVGHNPGLEELADLLIGSGDVALRAALQGRFPTGAVAVIGFVAPHWAEVKRGSGRLDRFVTPKLLGEEAL